MTNHESTALAKNPNIIKPAYKKDAIVILKADKGHGPLRIFWK